MMLEKTLLAYRLPAIIAIEFYPFQWMKLALILLLHSHGLILEVFGESG
jgi:hypothetical protein